MTNWGRKWWRTPWPYSGYRSIKPGLHSKGEKIIIKVSCHVWSLDFGDESHHCFEWLGIWKTTQQENGHGWAESRSDPLFLLPLLLLLTQRGSVCESERMRPFPFITSGGSRDAEWKDQLEMGRWVSLGDQFMKAARGPLSPSYNTMAKGIYVAVQELV